MSAKVLAVDESTVRLDLGSKQQGADLSAPTTRMVPVAEVERLRVKNHQQKAIILELPIARSD